METPTESIFNTLILYEKIPKNRVKNLKACKVDMVPLDEKKKLDKYVKYFSNDGFRVEYQLPELKNYGRIKQVPYTGLGTFCKEVRGYLAKGIYIDVDMVNCHPVILNSLFKKGGIDNKIIEDYVNNRTNFLESEKITKEDFLKMINKETCEANGKIKQLHTQIYSLLLSKITVECPELVNSIKKSKTENKKGKIIANYLQNIEFKMLSELFKFGSENGLLIDTLMHDGFFIRITDTINAKVIEENFIPKFEELIKNKFNIDMFFKIKEHDNTIKIEENQNTYLDYESVKRTFEKNHCKIINKSFFIKETDDNSLVVLTEKALTTSYKHLVYQETDEEGSIKTKPFISNWLFDNSMRIYEDIDCYPDTDKCPKNIFNVWRKFDMEFILEYVHKEAELQEILNHIKVLCGNNEEVYDYFIKWIAQMIQCPEIKSICPSLISKQGAGKGTLMQLFRKMLGNKKIMESTDPSRDVYGQFNGQMANGFLININEIGKKDTMDSIGKIKALITDSEITINTKGVNSYSTKSYHRFIITTQSMEPIETTQDDRRNFIFRCSDEKCGDKAYFERLYSLLDDLNVVKTCYEYFKSLKGADKFGTLKMPKTEHQKDLQTLSTSPIELWLQQLANFSSEETFEMTGSEALESFKVYCDHNGFKYEINSQKLGVRVKQLGIKGVSEGKHSRNGVVRTYNTREIKKHFSVSYSFLD